MTDLIIDLDPVPADRNETWPQAVAARATAFASAPGVRAVQVYAPLDDVAPYLTMTELTGVSGDAPLPNPHGTRRTYRLLAEWINDGYSPEASTHLQAVWMSVDDTDDFARWYSDEHVPLLFKVPGWLRCRRYQRESGDGPEYLALHDHAAASVATDPIGDEARSTAWRDRVMAYRTAYERANFVRELHLP